MRVLLAEDDPVSRRLLEVLLTKWDYEPVLAGDGAEAFRLLSGQDPPRLAVLDWMLPGMDGVELCREVRKRDEEPYIYILLLTARGNKQDVVEGLDAGADDYLTKPFDAHELKARLRAGARITELHEQLIRAREQLRAEATHDVLTGIWNRGAILEILHRELARGQRELSPIAILLADLDHFKQINDTYGHLAGDAVLREASRRMSSVIRTYDAIGRYGGEEFLVVSPGCKTGGALKQAERLRRKVSTQPVETFAGNLAISVSLGIALAGKTYDAASLLRAADEALYRAKNAGRDRVEVAGSEVLPRDPPPVTHPA